MAVGGLAVSSQRSVVGSCQNRGLSRITRITRIFVYCRFLVRRAGVCVLRSGDANWKVCGTKGSGIGVPFYKEEGRDSEVAPAYAQVSSLWYKYSNPPNPVIRGQEDRIFSFMEGMLSKRMVFSLMRLIPILALAFVARSAMAQFATILSVEDVSYAADNQIERGEVVVSVYVR